MQYKTQLPRAKFFHRAVYVGPSFLIYLQQFVLHKKHSHQGVTKRCRLSLLTNSAPRIRVQMGGGDGGGVVGSQPMSTAVHIT
jgi:hypothetical protein